MEKVKLKLFGISEIVGVDDVALLGLLDERQERQLIVTCDVEMRKIIQMHMMKKPETAKLYPQVMANILHSHPFSELEVRINDVEAVSIRQRFMILYLMSIILFVVAMVSFSLSCLMCQSMLRWT